MKARLLCFCGLLALALGFGSGCDGGSSEAVVVYVSADRAIARPILDRFTEKTGIDVLPLYDSEATKTTGLANRIRRERNAPRADVFWSSEPFAVEQLAAEGLLQPTVHPRLEAHPEPWRRPDDRWFAFAGRARVVAFDPERLPPEDRPASWADLIDPRWENEIAMADPRFGTTRGHVGAIAVANAIGEDRVDFDGWLEGLRRNRVRLLPGGNAATVDAVLRGEVLLGLTDSDDVRAARTRGLRVEAVAPRHRRPGASDGGTLLVPNAVGTITGTSRADQAAELVAYLASPEVEAMLRASPSGNYPLLGGDPSQPAEAGDDAHLAVDPWRVSIPEVALQMDQAVDEAMERLAGDPDSGDGG